MLYKDDIQKNVRIMIASFNNRDLTDVVFRDQAHAETIQGF